MLVFVACGELEDQEDAAAEPTATAEPAEGNGEESTAGDDPRDVLFNLFAATEADDYQTIYNHLISDFHIIPFDPDADERQQWIPTVAPRNFPTMFDYLEHPLDDPESWYVDEHDGFVIVRHREMRTEAHVFREENGEWRLDPGEFRLVQAWERSLPEDQRGADGFMTMPTHYQVESEIEEVDQFPLPGILMYALYTFTVHDSYADATVSWHTTSLPGEPIGDFDEYLYHDILIELDGLTWNLNGETGPVEIVWTDAILDDDYLRLPALPESMIDERLQIESAGTFGWFHATMRLLDLPEGTDESDEVVLRTGNLQIGPMGEGAPAGVDEPLHVRYEHTIPMTSSTRILTGEIPERPDDDPVAEVTPVPPDEVPPGPDPTEVMSVLDVEYLRDGEHVRAVITLDIGDTRLDWGRGFDIIWSDGETTTFAPESWAMQSVMEIEVEREHAPDGVEVEALYFEYVNFGLEPDPDAMVYEDRIETKWGDFPIWSIVESTDGSGFASYAAAGRRIIESSSMDHHGTSVRFSTSRFGLGDDFVPERPRLQFEAGFVDARADFPLPAEVQIREIAVDVVIEVES